MSSVPSHFRNVETEAQTRGGSWPRFHGLFVAEPGFRLQLGFLAVLPGAEQLTGAGKERFLVGVAHAGRLVCPEKQPDLVVEKPWTRLQHLDQLLPQGASPPPRMRPAPGGGGAVSALLMGTPGPIRSFTALPPTLPGSVSSSGDAERASDLPKITQPVFELGLLTP